MATTLVPAHDARTTRRDGVGHRVAPTGHAAGEPSLTRSSSTTTGPEPHPLLPRIERFEVRPTTDVAASESPVVPSGRATRRIDDGNRPAIQLIARTPPRARAAGADATGAAA